MPLIPETYTEEERAEIEADHDHDIGVARVAAHDDLLTLEGDLGRLRRRVSDLTRLYDVEFVETSAALRAPHAIAQIEVAIAALKHCLPGRDQ